MTFRCSLSLSLAIALTAPLLLSAGESLTPRFHHLRNAAPREWNHFPEQAEATDLTLSFDLDDPGRFQLLTLRQADVKQVWNVTLNGKKLGELERDQNDMEYALVIPPGILAAAGNELSIATTSTSPDDIRIGELILHEESRDKLTREAGILVTVSDADSGEPLPARLTIVDANRNTMVFIGASSGDRLAVRSGAVYTLDGQARFGVRAGRYHVWAGRGFEYSLAKTELDVAKGEVPEIALKLRREVPTPGLVACDTHLHTLEFAGHGDATLTERLITLAGEGLELPISTEHNQHIDYAPEARRIGADRFFTPGLELINSGAQQSDPMRIVRDWFALLRSGHRIAGVGSSDSHTVNFAIAGQARTYVPCPDDDPSNIDVAAAVEAFLAGKTHVSFGLLTRLDLTNDGGVTARVLGPGWTRATRLTLFRNGAPAREVLIPPEDAAAAGLKATTTWNLADLEVEAGTFLVAVAEGPGISAPWWPMMAPYQATTPEYSPYVMGVSSAVWPAGRMEHKTQ